MWTKVLMCLCLSALIRENYGTTSADYPNCKDVSYYFSPYQEPAPVPYNAILDRDGKRGLGFPTPFTTHRDRYFRYPRKQKDRTRKIKAFLSDYNKAFEWRQYTKGEFNFTTPQKTINTHRRFAVAGMVLWIATVDKNKQMRYYLKMNCFFDGKEPLPPSIATNLGFHWEDYKFDIPKNAVKGGIDPNNKPLPFYIGLVQYQRKTYIAKIIKDLGWMLIVTDNLQPLYISYARKIKILCSNEEGNTAWEVLTDQNLAHLQGKPNVGHIFRCKPDMEYLITKNIQACRGSQIEFLIYTAPFGYYV